MKKAELQTIIILTLVNINCIFAQQSTGEVLPNIVNILADDLGYGDISCFGATDILTPNIERIAEEGIRFTDFCSASPLSNPSRAAFLTGIYPKRICINDVFRTAADQSHFEKPGKKENTTLPQTGEIEVDGSRLSYVVEDEGITCLVIDSSIYYPRIFSKELRKHLKMYFVDMKWFAKGYKPEDLTMVNIQSIVNDVEQIRSALGLQMPLILGHSIHGTIATEYVKKYVSLVSGLIVIGSPCEWGNATYNEEAETLWKTSYKEIPQLKMVLFEKSGHTPQLEGNKLFDIELSDWINMNFK